VEHFRRFLGSRVRIRTREPLDGRRNFAGKLVGVEDGNVQVLVESGIATIPIVAMQKANVEYDFAEVAKR
jgi:ribosome maturation factor RimP